MTRSAIKMHNERWCYVGHGDRENRDKHAGRLCIEKRLEMWTPRALTTSSLLNMHTNTGRILALNPSCILRSVNKQERKHNVISSALRVPRAASQACPEAFNVVVSIKLVPWYNSIQTAGLPLDSITIRPLSRHQVFCGRAFSH